MSVENMTNDDFDFSKARQGAVIRPDTKIAAPIELDAAVVSWLGKEAYLAGSEYSDFVNAMLKQLMLKRKAELA